MSHPTAEQLDGQAQELLTDILQRETALKPKERMAIPAQEMPAQPAAVRRSNTSEVALGYSPAQAQLEAMRCLVCKKQPCVKGCPVAIDIRDFVSAMASGT